jgi:multidrug efflux pump subunit AcrA (membrane-fusion protein)
MRTRLVIPGVLSALLLVACGKEPAAPAKAPAPPVVRDVSLGAAVSTRVEETAEVMGTVRSRTTATLSSKIVAGIVAMHVREGSLVEAGALLIELDDRDIAASVRRAEAGLAEAQAAETEVGRAIAAAEAARAAAEAQRDLAAATLKRYQQLLERKSVAPQEYDQVLARQKAAAADVERAAAEEQAVRAKRLQVLARIEAAKAEIANAKVMLGYARIVAPWSGIVTVKQADVGTLAAPGTPLLTLEDNHRYWLELAIPDAQAAAVRPGQSLRMAVDAAGLSGSARVSDIVPAADPATRSTQVRLDLPASPQLRSGLFGRARLPVGQRQAILVPPGAVVERGQLQGVYAVDPNGIARFRLIRTGLTYPGGVEVLSGLVGGEQIVVSGADRVTDGARIERQ